MTNIALKYHCTFINIKDLHVGKNNCAIYMLSVNIFILCSHLYNKQDSKNNCIVAFGEVSFAKLNKTPKYVIELFVT